MSDANIRSTINDFFKNAPALTTCYGRCEKAFAENAADVWKLRLDAYGEKFGSPHFYELMARAEAREGETVAAAFHCLSSCEEIPFLGLGGVDPVAIAVNHLTAKYLSPPAE